MKRTALLLLGLLIAAGLHAKVYSVSSPSGRLEMQITTGKGATTWSLAVDGSMVMDSNRISITLDGRETGPDARVIKVVRRYVKEHIDAPLYRQRSFEANYNLLVLKMKGGWSIEARAYDDGVAYRFVTSNSGKTRVNGETVEFAFSEPVKMLVPYSPTRERDRYRNSFESQYEIVNSGDTGAARGRLAFMPVYADLGDKGKLLLMESDLWDYPGMFLRTTEKGFEAEFPPYPENPAVANGKYLDYLCDVDASRTYPWRIVAFGACDTDLPVNNMVYQLADGSRITDTSWIEPGFSTWDWWSNFKLHGVPFKSGINTDAYLYHIDFAAKYGIRYVLVDEGWYRNGDILHPIPEMDIPRLCSYAREKGVGLLLWINTNVLGLEPDKVFEQYAAMGVAGFKIDFFDNQEAAMIGRIAMYAQKAAQHHMVLDYHGIFKPVGLSRAYPNVLNYEGVVGLENAKGYTADQLDLPLNDVMIPYIRMAAGQMDYTPGALRNANRNDFRKINERPMSQGTRGHQVACYVVYDEPLAMLCDSPSDYLKEEETLRFITSMPTVFDHTSVLSGKVGEWIVTMREKDGKYYVGGMTSWQERDVEVDLSFLPEGDWTCRLFRDGINADKVATDYVIENLTVNSSTRLGVHMAPGGGFAMIITGFAR